MSFQPVGVKRCPAPGTTNLQRRLKFKAAPFRSGSQQSQRGFSQRKSPCLANLQEVGPDNIGDIRRLCRRMAFCLFLFFFYWFLVIGYWFLVSIGNRCVRIRFCMRSHTVRIFPSGIGAVFRLLRLLVVLGDLLVALRTQCLPVRP